jgi:hypothetical protein
VARNSGGPAAKILLQGRHHVPPEGPPPGPGPAFASRACRCVLQTCRSRARGVAKLLPATLLVTVDETCDAGGMAEHRGPATAATAAPGPRVLIQRWRRLPNWGLDVHSRCTAMVCLETTAGVDGGLRRASLNARNQEIPGARHLASQELCQRGSREVCRHAVVTNGRPCLLHEH